MEDNENDNNDGKPVNSFWTSTLILLRSSTVWKGLKHKIHKVRLQLGQSMNCFLILLLNVLWNWHSECFDLVGNGKCVHILFRTSVLLKNLPSKLPRVNVVQFFSPELGTRDDVLDWVILVGKEERESEDSFFPFLNIDPCAGAEALALLWVDFLVGKYQPESIYAKKTCSQNLSQDMYSKLCIWW